MAKYHIPFLPLLLLFACNRPGQDNTGAGSPAPAKQNTLAPLRVTDIGGLPDSLQPKTILLDGRPKPLTVVVPKASGGSFARKADIGNTGKRITAPPAIVVPPVLQDEDGRPITDANGQPFILGEGGISNFVTYTSDDGLALDDILSSCMDHAGNLWFGTDGGGVSRYDGKAFTSFSTNQGLSHNSVLAILEDRHHNMWFGTGGGGVSRYDGKTFTTFNEEQGLAHHTVMTIAEDRQGNLWFGNSSGGVNRFDGTSFTTFTTDQGLAYNSVRSIVEDRKGNLWFGTSRGVSRYDGTNFTTFTTRQGLADDYVRSIAEDRQGNLWFGTKAGVSRYDGTRFTTFTTRQGLADNYVRSIAEDHEGKLWFGTSVGVSCYDGTTFTSFTDGQGLANNLVLTITADKSGNLWFGTSRGGISRYASSAFMSFTTRQGLADNKVLTIAEDHHGNLWFGTVSGGASCYDGKAFTSFSTGQGMVDYGITAITEDHRGNLWFGTSYGLSRYDGEAFTTFTTDQGLPDNSIRCIAEDPQGNLWFGTNKGGASCFDGKSFTTYTTTQGLTHNKVLTIMVDRSGNLWIGTGGGGVSCYNGKTFTNITTDQGLADNYVRSIVEDPQGNLWFGTYGGGVSLLPAQAREALFRSDTAGTPAGLFRNFTTIDGLPDNFITQVTLGADGLLYAGTNFGFCEIFFQDGQWKVGRVFNSLTGYPVKDVNVGQNCMLKDSKGKIWIGTGSSKTALVRFDPKALRNDKQPPVVMLQNVQINETPVPWYSLRQPGSPAYPDSATLAQQEMMALGKVLSEQERDSMQQKYAGIRFDTIPPFYPLPENLVLPYRHNSISFDFVALETGVNASVRYQYILEGYNKGWSPETEKTSAVFGNIREGKHTFKVKAKSRGAVWSDPVTYTFTVLPPWWRTWWAYGAYALLFLFVLGVFTKWRERALLARQRVLEETVAERTAELLAEKLEVEKEKHRSDELLLNILPEEVAKELKAKGSSDAKQFNAVTVMFTDFKGFTQISEKLSPAELVAEIHFFFKAFDEIITKYNIEKIKTIGDSYMCAGGLPVANETNAIDVVSAALEIQEFMKTHQRRSKEEGREPFEIRIGVHTGPVVAGIVGVKKFAYDIWGDTVNIASRMESSGETGKVNISGSTYALVAAKFRCRHRGKIEAKGKGGIDMYFVEGAL